MTAEHVVGPRTVLANDATARVTPLELFFDLVFVYALTQVTAMLATNMSAIGFARGLVVLALVWWSWVGYSWLGNVAQADEGLLRVAFFLVMMAMFVMAITIPETFDDLPGGLDGPLVFAACYLVVHIVHVSLFWIAASGDAGLRRSSCSSPRPLSSRVRCSRPARSSARPGSSRCGRVRCWSTWSSRWPAAPPAGGSPRRATSPSGTA